ncbi:hypothetical protein [Clostridium sp.]|uniref:hypothetical protein n=1 Tax=Clostridium sp. TaxID=1506 RepID=UPI00262D9F58|nr:hypothetical protein [uncultured Clostridium sp.]
MANEMYSIKTDTAKKRFIIELKGFFQLEKAEQFVKDYNLALAQFKPGEYSFLIDARSLAVLKPEILPVLSQCYQLYTSSGFKKMVFVEPTVISAKMQVKRIAKESNLSALFVSSLEDAEKEL